MPLRTGAATPADYPASKAGWRDDRSLRSPAPYAQRPAVVPDLTLTPGAARTTDTQEICAARRQGAKA